MVRTTRKPLSDSVGALTEFRAATHRLRSGFSATSGAIATYSLRSLLRSLWRLRARRFAAMINTPSLPGHLISASSPFQLAAARRHCTVAVGLSCMALTATWSASAVTPLRLAAPRPSFSDTGFRFNQFFTVQPHPARSRCYNGGTVNNYICGTFRSCINIYVFVTSSA